MKKLVICSGGLDSVTLATEIAVDNTLHTLLCFNYGQRHHKELDYAVACARRYHVRHTIIDIKDVGKQLNNSALTGEIEVPDGHYAAENMCTTIVPNRNAIMLSIAFAVAVAEKIDQVAIAVHSGDHFIYPDCRPAFIKAFTQMQHVALEGLHDVELYAPYLALNKADIVCRGAKIGVDFINTWSCYKGGDIHCGRCGTCVERREAFAQSGIQDPTQYHDQTFWQTATGR